jgi:transketolase
MPCTRRFDAQADDWRAAVLPPALPTVAVEAGHPDGWRRYTGRSGAVIGIASFGESAPGPALMQHFGFTADAVMAAVRSRVATTPQA